MENNTSIIPEMNFNPAQFRSGKLAKIFSDPQKVLGKVFGLGIIGGVGYGIYLILPGLVAMAENVLMLGVYGLIGVGLAYVVINKKFRNNIAMGFDQLMNAVAGFIISIDKVAVLRKGLQNMRKSLDFALDQQGALKGSLEGIDEAIGQNNQDIETNLGLLDQAKKQKLSSAQISYYSTAIEDCQESNKRLRPLKDNIERLDLYVGKLHECGVMKVKTLERKIDLMEREQKATGTGLKAISSVFNMLGRQQQDNFDRAFNALKDEISLNKGAIENILQASRGDIQTLDLRNGVMQSKGLALMEKIDKLGYDAVLHQLTTSTGSLPEAALSAVEEKEGEQPKYNIFK
jgi:hypothetical protein